MIDAFAAVGAHDDQVAVALFGIAHNLLTRVALQECRLLALWDDSNSPKDVFRFLNDKLGRSAGDAFRSVKEGAHGAFNGELADLIRSTERIAQELRRAS